MSIRRSFYWSPRSPGSGMSRMVRSGESIAGRNDHAQPALAIQIVLRTPLLLPRKAACQRAEQRWPEDDETHRSVDPASNARRRESLAKAKSESTGKVEHLLWTRCEDAL